MIKGFRFTNQLANAEVDARIHQEFLNKNDGIFYGMDLSKTNNSITVSEGLCEIAGRPVAIIGSETIQTSNENLYCVLVLEIDLSKDSTKDTFNQVTFKLLTSNSSYSDVTQQDINKFAGTDKIYQLEFARFKSGTNGITDFKDTRKFLNFDSIYDEIRKEIQNIEDEGIFVLKSNKVILYDGKAETTNTIVLNDDINNYQKIEIHINDKQINTFEGKNGENTLVFCKGIGGSLRTFFGNIVFADNEIRFQQQYFVDSENGYRQEYAGIAITKVVGYK